MQLKCESQEKMTLLNIGKICIIIDMPKEAREQIFIGE